MINRKFLILVFLTFLVPFSAAAQSNGASNYKETLENITRDLGKCDAIATTFERLRCFDEVVEKYNITENTGVDNMETPLDIGKWTIKKEHSDIDGQSVIYMSLPPENGIQIGLKRNLKPNLFVRCVTDTDDYDGSVYIVWGTEISQKDSIYIKRRFERETPIASYWTVSSDKQGSFYDKPLAMIPELLKYRSLRIEAIYRQSPLDTLVYDLRGFDNVVRTVKDICGWN